MGVRPLKVVFVTGLFAGLHFRPFLVGGLYPVLLAAFSPVFPESEILRVKVWVYTAPLWLHLPQTTALVLEGLHGTSTSLLPSITAGYSAFAPHCSALGAEAPLGRRPGRRFPPSGYDPTRKCQAQLPARGSFEALNYFF